MVAKPNTAFPFVRIVRVSCVSLLASPLTNNLSLSSLSLTLSLSHHHLSSPRHLSLSLFITLSLPVSSTIESEHCYSTTAGQF